MMPLERPPVIPSGGRQKKRNTLRKKIRDLDIPVIRGVA